MQRVAPEGPVYQGGTLSGNPLATAAGLATLAVLRDDPPYERLEAAAARLQAAIEAAGEGRVQVNRMGSMLTPFMASEPVSDYVSAKRSDTDAYARLFHRLLAAGVYVPPSQFEAWFLSDALDEPALAGMEGALHDAWRCCSAVSRHGAAGG